MTAIRSWRFPCSFLLFKQSILYCLLSHLLHFTTPVHLFFIRCVRVSLLSFTLRILLFSFLIHLFFHFSTFHVYHFSILLLFLAVLYTAVSLSISIYDNDSSEEGLNSIWFWLFSEVCRVDGGWVELEARTTASSGKEDFLEVSLLRAGKMKDEGGINIGPLWAPRTLSVEINGLKDVFWTGLKDTFGRSCSLSLKAASLSLNICIKNKQTNRRSY